MATLRSISPCPLPGLSGPPSSLGLLAWRSLLQRQPQHLPSSSGASLTPSLLPLLFGQQLGPSWCSTRLFGIHTAGGIRFSSLKGHTGHILSWLRNCSLLSIEKWKPFILPFKVLNLFSASSVVPSFNCWLPLATLY